MVRIRCSILPLLVIVGGVAFFGCSTSPKTSSEIEWSHFQEGGISISYPKSIFDSAELYLLPKKVENHAAPVVFGPRRWVLHLKGAPRGSLESSGPRYFFPSESNIYITPLVDDSVQEFDVAYSGLSGNAKDIRKWLTDRRWDQKQGQFPGIMQFPNVPFVNAARAIQAKFRRIDSPSLQGFRMLTYL